MVNQIQYHFETLKNGNWARIPGSEQTFQNRRVEAYLMDNNVGVSHYAPSEGSYVKPILGETRNDKSRVILANDLIEAFRSPIEMSIVRYVRKGNDVQTALDVITDNDVVASTIPGSRYVQPIELTVEPTIIEVRDIVDLRMDSDTLQRVRTSALAHGVENARTRIVLKPLKKPTT